MSDRSRQNTLTGRFATVGICVGALSITGGLALVAIALIEGAAPAASGPEGIVAVAMATFPGVVLGVLGLGLVLRGMHMRLTLETLQALRQASGQVRNRAPAVPTDVRAELRAVETDPAPSHQSELRASKANPIKGKPFRPHPIFMARPPK
ncbi:MAG: hypothetical protein WBA67_16195 [Jannaschia sp.]